MKKSNVYTRTNAYGERGRFFISGNNREPNETKRNETKRKQEKEKKKKEKKERKKKERIVFCQHGVIGAVNYFVRRQV